MRMLSDNSGSGALGCRGVGMSMEPPVYKPYYWGLDTVFNAKVKLRISDILSLKKYPGFQGAAE